MSEKLSFLGTGVVIEDMKPDAKVIKVTLIDGVEQDGILGNEKSVSTVITDNSSKRKVSIGKEVDFIEAVWEGEDNKINAPTITKGEQVTVTRYRNQDVYYWSKSRGFETDLRGREVVIEGCSTIDRSLESNLGKSVTKEDMYYIIKDTINGKIEIGTNDKNGEKAAYILLLDGKNGAASLTDNKGNSIVIDSVKGEISGVATKAINLKAPKINLECDELNIDTKKTNFNSTTTILKGSKFTGDVSKTLFTGAVTIKGVTTLKAAIKGAGGVFKSAVSFLATKKTW